MLNKMTGESKFPSQHLKFLEVFALCLLGRRQEKSTDNFPYIIPCPSLNASCIVR